MMLFHQRHRFAVTLLLLSGLLPLGPAEAAPPKQPAFKLRLLKKADLPKLQSFFAQVSARDRYQRYMGHVNKLPGCDSSMASKSKGEVAIVAVDPKTSAIIGMARSYAVDRNQRAEFSLLVRSDQQRRGIGRGLMTSIIDHNRQKGLKSLWGMVLRSNLGMLKMAGQYGFKREAGEDFSTCNVSLDLR